MLTSLLFIQTSITVCKNTMTMTNLLAEHLQTLGPYMVSKLNISYMGDCGITSVEVNDE